MASGDDIQVRIGGEASGAKAAVEQTLTAMQQLHAESIAGGRILDQYSLSWGGLGQAMLGNLGTFGQWTVTAGSAVFLVTQLMQGFQSLIAPIEQVGQAIASISFEVLQEGVSLLQQLGQQAFQLNEMTERNYFNLSYLYGGPAHGGPAVANQLVQWSMGASLRMPFTRQDLMAAMTTLAVMPGMTPTAEEKDLMLLSDVASTQGRPGLTLQWAAMAALRGGEGYGRMLLMDLNLSEATMRQYGYDKSNPSSFFPALQRYEAAKQGGNYRPGDIGAYTAQNTFWGAETSFVDRLQNWALSMGGWNQNPKGLTDDVRKGSLFYWLKTDLTGISEWMDAHQGLLNTLSDAAGKLFGAGMQAGQTIFGGLFDALQKSGAGDMLLKDLTDLVHYLGQPDVQASLHTVGEVIGNVVGQGVPTAIDAVKQFFAGVLDSGAGTAILADLKMFAQWIGSGDAKVQIQGAAYIIGHTLGDAFNAVNAAAVMAGSSMGDFFKVLGDGVQLIRDINNPTAFMDDLHRLSHDITQLENNAASAALNYQAALASLNSDLNPPGTNKPGGPAGKSIGAVGADVQHILHHHGKGAISIGPALGQYVTSQAGVGNEIAHGVTGYLAWVQANAGHIIGSNIGSAAGHATGQDFVNAYVSTAQQMMSQQQTSDAVVTPFITSLKKSISDGSTTLAQTLLQVIDQEVRLQTANQLAHENLFGNLAGRSNGGQRLGPSLGFQ